jgi:serine/threonine-protein kinase
MPMFRKVLCATSLCFSLGASLNASLAHAGDAATAEALFRDGRALMEAGNYQAACPKLEESYAQDPATGTLLALGICQERSGLTASAWATFSDAAARAKRDGRADRERAAREHMTALEPKLAHLTIQVDPSLTTLAGFSVKRDGREVGAGAWGASVPIDPGEHVVEATAPGRKPFNTKLTVPAQAVAQTVQIPALELEPTAAATDTKPGATSPEPPLGEAQRTVAPLRLPGLIIGGVGIVTLGVSGIFALRAVSLNSESKENGHCDAQNQCDDIGGPKRDEAKTAANVATVTVLAGTALTALGVTLFLLKPRSEHAQSAHVEALPVFGRDQAGMALQGRF